MAGLPTAQNLRSASRGGVYRNSARGGLPAGLILWPVRISKLWERRCGDPTCSRRGHQIQHHHWL